MEHESAPGRARAVVKGEVTTHLPCERPADEETEPTADLGRSLVANEWLKEPCATRFGDARTRILDRDLETVFVLDADNDAATLPRIHQGVVDQVVQNAQRAPLITLRDG
jgi:hypothetical protein